MADIDFGQLSEALNDKADRDLHNVDTTAKADAVIDYQEPTSANNYTWYRKYKSGWVEQGGFMDNNNTDGVITFNLPIEMANGLYYRNLCLSMTNNTGTASNYGAAKAAGCYNSETTTTVSFQKQGGQKYGFWQVSGMAAN